MSHVDPLAIRTLGTCHFRSPLKLSTVRGDGVGDFMRDDVRVLEQIEFTAGHPPDAARAFERSGAREYLYFDPPRTTAAIVTCGGLCPGLNDVIRAAYYELHHNYGVARVLGIRFGYRGLNPAEGLPPIELTPESVEEISAIGGTILGSSRGPQPVETMVDFLVAQGIQILLCVGGDGTMRGAHALSEEIARRGLSISVVGIPKTIDNDIPCVERSFGFDTAIEKALEHIAGAHNEARGVYNGVGLVKLMGRQAGFIAATATLASGHVNFTLVPEVEFRLEGPGGLFDRLQKRLAERHHAVIVVAEGAGQYLLKDRPIEHDASGNAKPGDIGLFLREQIAQYFKARNMECKLTYLDPSYHIRSLPANCSDHIHSNKLARRAVHAAMAGKTDLLVGYLHSLFIHVPLPLATGERKEMCPESDLWMSVIAATGQGDLR